MILCAVQDAKDDDVPADDAEKDFVGKPVREGAAKTAVVKREAFGISLQTQEGFGVVGKKFVTQSGASFLIPIVCFAEISLGLGPDGDVPFHRRDARISRKTSRQGWPGLGSRSNSESASSSACRSANVGEPPSSRSASWSSASRAKSWERSLTVSFGSSSRICALLMPRI